ncbi:U11/U12 small nuclear ribonucleoprotein 25 kDa protein-like [Patiria miniata]|uniref:Ubiquitin-like domain-containing protein n=1 Tax=Patiria miniata TaxID=46514 RepID=A0A913ZJ54_PATMI|nr:U11/U12 small nuclear ribonucleoprotein 25 kDa protein-like [Patiria miniata]XP_038051823.1 U11/U12 small nuclear ribonucleoprotein 25 kDa protein-like [Patiria miniata]
MAMMADNLESAFATTVEPIDRVDSPQPTISTAPCDEPQDKPEDSIPDTPQSTSHDEPESTAASSGEVTHDEAMRILREGLGEVFRDDPLLSDLPFEVTAEEVGLQIALEYGQAMTVSVQKFTGELMPIVVMQGARVQDLKQAIQRYVTLKESRRGSQTSISWKYVWRTYSLCFEGEQLDKNKKLKDYGIRNRDTVTFVKRRRQLGDKY